MESLENENNAITRLFAILHFMAAGNWRSGSKIWVLKLDQKAKTIDANHQLANHYEPKTTMSNKEHKNTFKDLKMYKSGGQIYSHLCKGLCI
jgi:hypothetical protein